MNETYRHREKTNKGQLGQVHLKICHHFFFFLAVAVGTPFGASFESFFEVCFVLSVSTALGLSGSSGFRGNLKYKAR